MAAHRSSMTNSQGAAWSPIIALPMSDRFITSTNPPNEKFIAKGIAGGRVRITGKPFAFANGLMVAAIRIFLMLIPI